jgi:adenosylcobinamide kinase/adenosylcobinamide-phosphate guanylyltransferase
MSRIIFVTGGARSGKSAFAQELAASFADVGYVATASITDEEMRERVRIHQQSRPESWATFEAQKNLPAVFEKNTHEAFLLDCLTVYIANAVVDVVNEEDEIINVRVQDAIEEQIMRDIERMLNTVREKDITLIVVSNEVGMGLVPAYPMGRMFRDVVGRANKKVASSADEAYFVVSGIPIKLKG